VRGVAIHPTPIERGVGRGAQGRAQRPVWFVNLWGVCELHEATARSRYLVGCGFPLRNDVESRYRDSAWIACCSFSGR